jgi:hypothetical protein
MDTSLSVFRSQTLEATLALMWRQWCTLGVAGHVPPVSGEQLIDLEALILATSSVGRHDPRLFDEALDWLCAYGSLVNLHRLRILQGHGFGHEAVLRGLADAVHARNKQQKWKIFRKSRKNFQASEPEALYVDQAQLTVRNPDPHFLEYGILKPETEPRGMSRAPDPGHPSNLMPVLRALMGADARVEIILCLAGGAGPAHATEIAMATGYSPRTVQALLQEMSLSGQLSGPAAKRDDTGPIRRGTNRRYTFRSENWQFLTRGNPFPAWTPWASVFRLSETVLKEIPIIAPPPPAVVLSSRLRTVLKEEARPLTNAGFLDVMDLKLDAKSAVLLENFYTGFQNLLGRLAGSNEG